MEKQSSSNKPPTKLLSFKLHYTAARNSFPFDKFYLVKEVDLPAVTQAFPYSLSMKLEGWHLEKLKNIRVHTAQSKSMGRGVRKFHFLGGHKPKCNPESEGEVLWRAKGSAVSELEDLVVSSLASEGWVSESNSTAWHILIPVLSVYRTGDLSARPAYLTNPAWLTKIEEGRVRPINNSAVLHRHDSESLSPPCLACSNMLTRLSGGCELGSTACFKSMNFGKDSHFRRGLEIQKLLPKMSLLEAFRKYCTKPDAV